VPGARLVRQRCASVAHPDFPTAGTKSGRRGGSKTRSGAKNPLRIFPRSVGSDEPPRAQRRAPRLVMEVLDFYQCVLSPFLTAFQPATYPQRSRRKVTTKPSQSRNMLKLCGCLVTTSRNSEIYSRGIASGFGNGRKPISKPGISIITRGVFSNAPAAVHFISGVHSENNGASGGAPDYMEAELSCGDFVLNKSLNELNNFFPLTARQI
jgi:hypothetical protein